jgi:hypothetical protein
MGGTNSFINFDLFEFIVFLPHYVSNYPEYRILVHLAKNR